MNSLSVFLLSCFFVFSVVMATGGYGQSSYGSYGYGNAQNFGSRNPYSYLTDDVNNMNRQMGGSGGFIVLVILMFCVIITFNSNLSFNG